MLNVRIQIMEQKQQQGEKVNDVTSIDHVRKQQAPDQLQNYSENQFEVFDDQGENQQNYQEERDADEGKNLWDERENVGEGEQEGEQENQFYFENKEYKEEPEQIQKEEEDQKINIQRQQQEQYIKDREQRLFTPKMPVYNEKQDIDKPEQQKQQHQEPKKLDTKQEEMIQLKNLQNSSLEQSQIEKEEKNYRLWQLESQQQKKQRQNYQQQSEDIQFISPIRVKPQETKPIHKNTLKYQIQHIDEVKQKVESDGKKNAEKQKQSTDSFWYKEIDAHLNEDYETYKELSFIAKMQSIRDQGPFEHKYSTKQQKNIPDKQTSKITKKKLPKSDSIDIWANLRQQIEQNQKIKNHAAVEEPPKIQLNKSADIQQKSIQKNKAKRENKKVIKDDMQEKISEQKKEEKVIEKIGSIDKQIRNKIKEWSRENRKIFKRRQKENEEREYKIWMEEQKKREMVKLKLEEERIERGKAASDRLQKVHEIKENKQKNSRILEFRQKSRQRESIINSHSYVKLSKLHQIDLQQPPNLHHKKEGLQKRRKAYSDKDLRIKINKEEYKLADNKVKKARKISEMIPDKNPQFAKYKQSIEFQYKDDQKLNRRRQFNDRVREIPINVNNKKKKQLLIKIDKDMNPIKYQVLKKKGLTDLQIYESSKQFEVVNAKEQREIGKEYLKNLRKNNSKLYRSLDRSQNGRVEKQKKRELVGERERKLLIYESDLQKLKAKLLQEQREMAKILNPEKLRQKKLLQQKQEDRKYLKALGL